MFNHIASDPEILNGKPHIIGTRLSIEFVFELFASGATKEDVIKSYPQLTVDAIEEVLKYAEDFQKTVNHVVDKNAELYRKLS